MEPARPVEDRWRRSAHAWPVTRVWPVVVPDAAETRSAPSPDDDELPPTSRIAAQSERTCRNAIVEAAELTGQHIDIEALANAVARRSELDIDRLLLPGLFATLLQQRLEPRFQTVFRHGVDHTAGQLRQMGIAVKQLETDLTEPYRQAGAWARQHAARLITGISAQQREAVRRLLARAVEEGLSPREVAQALRRTIGLRPDQVEAVRRFGAELRRRGVARDAVRRRVDRYREAHRRQRATLIARTELIGAVNAGQLAVWGEAVRVGALPRAARKQWIVTEDERLCPVCEELGAESPIPLEQAFDGVDMFAPPAHPACRCALGLIVLQSSRR